MERLRDIRRSEDATLALAAELVASRSPSQASVHMLERVRRSLEAPTRRARPRGGLPLALAGLLVLGMIGAASARYGRAVIERVRRVVSLHRDVPARSDDLVASVVAPPVEAPSVFPAAVTAPAAKPPDAAGARHERRRSKVTASVRVADAVPALVESTSSEHPHVDSGASLVEGGLRALRRDHDLEQAAGLFDQYLALHLDGALAEEALAFRIEIAATRGDPDAAELARRYLQRFPAGRFRKMAGTTPDRRRP